MLITIVQPYIAFVTHLRRGLRFVLCRYALIRRQPPQTAPALLLGHGPEEVVCRRLGASVLQPILECPSIFQSFPLGQRRAHEISSPQVLEWLSLLDEQWQCENM